MSLTTKQLFVALGALLLLGLALVAYTTFMRAEADVSIHNETFHAMLTPEQEVPPTTGSTTASGTAHFMVRSNGAAIDYSVHVNNLSSAVTGAHLHCAPVGQNGPVVVPLMITTMGTTTATSTASSTSAITMDNIQSAGMNCSPNIQTLTHLVQAMREGMVYVNVHTTKLPNGEIRGQVMKELMTPSPTATSTATATPSVSPTISPTATPTPTMTMTPSPSPTPTTSVMPTPTPHTGTAHNGAYIALSSYFLTPNQTFSVSGKYFAAHESVTVNAGGMLQTVHTDSMGSFTSAMFTVPFSAIGSQMSVSAHGNSSGIHRSAQLSVMSYHPWITLSSYYAGAGSSLTISGNGYGPGEQVKIWFAGAHVGTVAASNSGAFSFSMTVPSGGAGQKVITATGQSTSRTDTESFSQSH